MGIHCCSLNCSSRRSLLSKTSVAAHLTVCLAHSCFQVWLRTAEFVFENRDKCDPQKIARQLKQDLSEDFGEPYAWCTLSLKGSFVLRLTIRWTRNHTACSPMWRTLCPSHLDYLGQLCYSMFRCATLLKMDNPVTFASPRCSAHSLSSVIINISHHKLFL